MPAKGIEKVYFSEDLSPTQRLMLFRQAFQGRRYIHLRVWFQAGSGEEFRPGKGLVLPSNPVTLHELASALHELADDFPWDDRGSGFSSDADTIDKRAESDGPEVKG